MPNCPLCHPDGQAGNEDPPAGEERQAWRQSFDHVSGGFRYELWPVSGGPSQNNQFEVVLKELGMEAEILAPPIVGALWYRGPSGEYAPFEAMALQGLTPEESEEVGRFFTDLTSITPQQLDALDDITFHINVSAFSKLTGFMPTEKLSIGIPVPDTEVKLVDPETGEEVPFGEAGEIWIRGPQLMKGYWPTPGGGLIDGWLATGDIARMDEDGYFYILDRVKDMANVSGLKVYTTEIDDVLFKHPAVAMAVAIGIPDPERSGSERIKAFIKLKEGYEGKVTADEIIEFCRDKVEPYARPKFVEFKEDMPLTVTEKLFKRELREEEIRKMKERGELK